MPKANNPTNEPEKKEETSEQTRQARVHWDTADMRNTYANVCNVTSTREEVMLLFGTNQTWFTGQTDLAVKLSDRVILNPFTAKRLSMLLTNVLKEYEIRFGKLKVEIDDQTSGSTQS